MAPTANPTNRTNPGKHLETTGQAREQGAFRDQAGTSAKPPPLA